MREHGERPERYVTRPEFAAQVAITRMAGGVVDVPGGVAAGVTKEFTITFPAGRFTVQPGLSVTPVFGDPTLLYACTINTLNATAATVRIRTTSYSGTISISWVAVQS